MITGGRQGQRMVSVLATFSPMSAPAPAPAPDATAPDDDAPAPDAAPPLPEPTVSVQRTESDEGEATSVWFFDDEERGA